MDAEYFEFIGHVVGKQILADVPAVDGLATVGTGIMALVPALQAIETESVSGLIHRYPQKRREGS